MSIKTTFFSSLLMLDRMNYSGLALISFEEQQLELYVSSGRMITASLEKSSGHEALFLFDDLVLGRDCTTELVECLVVRQEHFTRITIQKILSVLMERRRYKKLTWWQNVEGLSQIHFVQRGE
jgi:hypothetical protein